MTMNLDLRHRERAKRLKENLLGWGLILPAVLIIIGICIVPIIQTFLYSLQYYKLTEPNKTHYIGFANYADIFSSPSFYHNLKNTAIFTVFSVSLELVLGLIAALLMNGLKRGVSAVRTSILIPWCLPGIVVGQMFKFIFDGQYGLINSIMKHVGLLGEVESFAFLSKVGWAMGAVIIADAWKQFPFVALLLLAGLQVISKDLYEAADVDGATKIRQFFHITLPLIKPMIMVAVVFRTMSAIRIFDIVYSMTSGGPANTTSTILYTSYTLLFGDLNYGKGSAMAFVIFAIIFVITMLYLRLMDGSDSN